ncbi:nose resistant to fluoxetine protein 6-like isoform X2 [Dermacentor variabilis]|uniref:nose resistant to fluoxetine protein 6-like isoform X2 n=1 Tax=Dermacentor variabilis TaxID=34621 RepID=UPI003F5B1586
MILFRRADASTAVLPLALLVCSWLTLCDGKTEDASPFIASTEEPEVKYLDTLKQWIASAMDRAPRGLMRKVLAADISVQCSLGLFKLVRGIRNLEPWVLRLLDATGKYPTGVLQVSRTDLGAFDECVETVVLNDFGHETVRGQYCNLQLYSGNRSDLDDRIMAAIALRHPRIGRFRAHAKERRIPFVRIGICVMNACNEREMEALMRAVLPPGIHVTISDCVTEISPGWTRTQLVIVAFIAFLTAMIAIGTAVDVRSTRTFQKNKKQNILVTALASFSMVANTRSIFKTTGDAISGDCSLGFLHGMKAVSLIWIVVGHCYVSNSHVWSRMVNVVLYADGWTSVFAGLGSIGFDSLFFLTGFLLAYVVCKHKGSRLTIFLFEVTKRYIRTTVPTFFVIMCLYLLPLIASGPNAKEYFTKVHNDLTAHWLFLLLQVQNYAVSADPNVPPFTYLWYVSLDFQFFLLCLLMLLLVKNRPRLAVTVFFFSSLVGCSVATWQVAGNEMTPFVVPLTEAPSTFLRTRSYYFFYPYYHAVCCFSGCLTYFVAASFKERKIPNALQKAAWCFAIASGLCCMCIKGPWYRNTAPTTELGKLCTAFFDRILWSVFLAWVTFACATGRGGFVASLLSWRALRPFSRLAFGMYVVHMPFMQFTLHISRERMFFSHFFVTSFAMVVLTWGFLLTYLLYVYCEAPACRMTELLFKARCTKSGSTAGDELPIVFGSEEILPHIGATFHKAEKESATKKMGTINTLDSFHRGNSSLVSCHL